MALIAVYSVDLEDSLSHENLTIPIIPKHNNIISVKLHFRNTELIKLKFKTHFAAQIGK